MLSIENTYPDCDLNPTPSPNEEATFIRDVTLPDYTVVSPGASLVKTWRVRNSGTSTWGSGYQLVFVGGNQMGAPGAVSIPAAGPGQEVNLSVNMVAPSSNGAYTGYWRLRNPQGTFFGPTLFVKINVQTTSGYITILSTDPPSPADTSSVQIRVKVEGFPNLRATRLLIDGEVKYELGGPEFIYTWNTGGYAIGDHSIVVEVADQTDTAWSRPERRVITYRLLGTGAAPNHAPYRPTPTSPYNWYVYYSGNTAQLCAQANGDPDGDAIAAYYFDVYDSAQLWNSGWIAGNCVTTAALGPYTYQWRVKVRDSRGAESDWSDSWHFTLVNPNLSITELYFESQDANSEVVKIRACTAGQGGVGITMRVSVNDATDGSATGTWHTIKELGVPCFNAEDAPIWHTLGYGSGVHRVRVEAHGAHTSWDGAAVREATYTLPHRRPSSPRLAAPVSPSTNSNDPIYLNSRTVLFQWNPALRATNYTLHISTASSPADDPDPVFRQVLDANVTQYTVTLSQDYPTLYWQVVAANDKGSTSSSTQRFGIDRAAPSCDIQSLPDVTYENVFQVSWTSSDNTSGTRFTDIQYLDGDRGEWQGWYTFLPATQTFGLFNGQYGHSYRFRCRSVDYANNTGDYSDPSSAIQVDLNARPLEPWWNSAYSQKRSITVLNNVTDKSLLIDYPVHIRFDNTTTPSAETIFDSSESSVKCDDLRVIYNNTVELARHIPVCQNDLIEIWFKNQETIAPATANNTAYRLYYGYAGADDPPDNQTDIWYPLVDANTVGLWFFSEGTGTSIADHSGYGNHGNKGTLTWVDGLFAKALASTDHAGGNGAFVPGNASMGSSAFTLEFYAKRDDLEGGYIAGQGASGNDRERMRLRVEGTGSIRLQIDPPSPGGASDIWGRSVCLRDMQWQHIAVTFDGYRTGQIYCGGVLAGSGLFNDSGISNRNFDLYLGSDFSTSARFKGKIDQVRLSNVVRTSFSYAQFATITLPPSLLAGDLIAAPTGTQPDLAIQTLRTYLGLNGEPIVEAVIRNLGLQNTQNGFYTDLYVNHVPTGIGDYTGSVQFWINSPIAAGAQVTLTTIITDFAGLGGSIAGALSAPGAEVTATLYSQVDSVGVISETDKANNISPGVDICLASSDAYEDDNDVSRASLLLLGQTQQRNFDRPADRDWVKFNAQSGVTYTIRTFDLANNTDTYLYLYDTDGATLLAANDDYDGSLASRIDWMAPVTGTYYALVQHWNPNVGGCGTGYKLSVTVTEYTPIKAISLFLPLVLKQYIPPNPDFVLTATPLQAQVTQGRVYTYTIQLVTQGGFAGPVALTVTGLPQHVSASWSAASVTPPGSSHLVLITSQDTPTGQYMLHITGRSGALVHSVEVTLDIVAPSTPTFVAIPAFGMGNTRAVAWGDYDNDNDLDLAVGNDEGQNYLYINQGGTFDEVPQFGAERTWSLAWADYDNDNNLDLAVGSGYGWAQNYLYTNNGDGTFTYTLAFGSASTEGLAWGDYDNDGDLDLAVGNEWAQQNYLYINNGNGTFIASPEFGISDTHSVAWGDYDNDNDLDLAVGNTDQNYLFINHNGVFSRTIAFGGGGTKAVAWADYDGDGDLDLAVGNDDNQQNMLYINNGDGTFTALSMFGTGRTRALAWGDFDNDGDLDLAVGNGWNGQNYLYINNGDGTFSEMALFGIGDTNSVAWGDYDNDGDLDLAVGNGGVGQNYLYVNQLVP